ncbi:MAG: low temperature requirement protein A [Burkholderiales bacterium]|nr:low temperature requirement protein A [Burkholderiales bacterium]
MVELFFDLVFVFAVTQLSHTLLAHPEPRTALEVGVLLTAVWWVWIYTSWTTNWLDPERIPVRVCMFVLMLAGLALSVSIPQAFGERGLAFAAAYTFMQVGRTSFFLWAVRHERAGMRRNFQRILAWLALAAVFWIAGGFASDGARLALWAVALGIEIVSPAIYFWVPGLGRSSVADWDVDGGHMAERCALFIIIALGESLLVTGSTFAQTAWNGAIVGGFLSAFVGTVAMWWLYFHRGAAAGHHRIAAAADPGRPARLAYTYLHLPIVAGIIVSAVADEMVLAHPGHAGAAAIVAAIGGPALYLGGVAAFKWVSYDRMLPPLSHMVGLVLLAALIVPAALHLLSALALHVATTAVLVIVGAWEEISLARAPRTG